MYVFPLVFTLCLSSLACTHNCRTGVNFCFLIGSRLYLGLLRREKNSFASLLFVPGQAGCPNLSGKGVCQSSSNEIWVTGQPQSEKKLSPWVREVRLDLEYL